MPVVRVTTSSGAQGVGLSRLDEGTAHRALQMDLSTLFEEGSGAPRNPGDHWTLPCGTCPERSPERPFTGLSAAHVSAGAERAVPVPAVCQLRPPGFFIRAMTPLFTSMTCLPTRRSGTTQRAPPSWPRKPMGVERGHRAFKVKVGRGARWMATDAGLDRDVAVVGAVRDAIGPDCNLFADANNGYTLNLAKEFLERTASYRWGGWKNRSTKTPFC